MTLLGRDAILSADDAPFVDVDMPEWGGPVRLKALNGFDFSRYMKAVSADNESLDRSTPLLIALSAVDENGELLFTEKDVDAIGKKSGRALLRLKLAAMELNRPDVVEAKKNLEKMTSGDGPTDSPANSE